MGFRLLQEIWVQMLRSKYSHKLLDHVKQSAVDALITTSKSAIQKQQKQLAI